MSQAPDVSVVICTYNRGELLKQALESVAAQRAGDVRYEVLIVNNNSTDETQQVIDAFVAGRDGWRALFEARQGLSYARNTGIEHARAPIIAFTDDDIVVSPTWIGEIKRAMDEHPEVDFIGGKVLPRWTSAPPAWLTKRHWVPLAVVDHGDEPFTVSLSRPWCMVGANLSIRKQALVKAGGFSPRFQRVKDSIGSTEDHEFQYRLWQEGRLGMYVPSVVVESDVQEDRLRKAYHRRWHAGHARFSAMMGTETITDDMPELFGMPACFIRLMAEHGTGWITSTATGRSDQAFHHENKIRFLINYVRQLHELEPTSGSRHTLARTVRGVRELLRRKVTTG